MSEGKEFGRVAVMGIGGGGGRIAAELAADSSARWLDIAVVNTDEAELNECSNVHRIAIGQDWTDNQGCGGDIARGEKAAGASASRLAEFIRAADILIVIATLGGGTGSGAAPVIARQAVSQKVLSFFFVTLPFRFEGNAKYRTAEKALKTLREVGDAVVCLPNDLLFMSSMSGHMNASEGFREATRIWAECVLGMAELIRCRGMITVDFAHVRQLLEKREADCRIGIGHGKGPKRFDEAISTLLTSPILGGDEVLMKADAVILTLLCGEDTSLAEASQCIEKAQKLVNPRAEFIVGMSAESSREGTIQLTALCINYPNKAKVLQPEPAQNSKPRKPIKPRPVTQTNIQGELPLQELSTGHFPKESPTLHKGENLDIPTFLRQGLKIDAGN